MIDGEYEADDMFPGVSVMDSNDDEILLTTAHCNLADELARGDGLRLCCLGEEGVLLLAVVVL